MFLPRVPSGCFLGVGAVQGSGVLVGTALSPDPPAPRLFFLRLFGLDHSIWIRFIRFCLPCLWRCFP